MTLLKMPIMKGDSSLIFASHSLVTTSYCRHYKIRAKTTTLDSYISKKYDMRSINKIALLKV